MSDTTSPRLAEMRRDYLQGGLDETAAPADPLVLFRSWFQAAVDAGVPEPNAMTLATVSADGRPAARIVLLKGFGPEGFVLFTSRVGRKGRELAINPRAALVFHWHALERQVRVEGMVAELPRAETEAYFARRPRDAQLGAWASRQSTPIDDRAALERQLAETGDRFADGPIPAPPFWGGYRVTPESIEFWQGRPSRLHDRLLYESSTDGWRRTRLSP